MKYFQHLLFLSIISFVLVSTGCKSKSALVDNAQKENQYKPLANSLLWQIDGNGLAAPSYLYGTIHIIDSESFFLPEGTLGAIDKSKKMVFEIDMNEMNDMSNMMGLMSKAFMADGKTLKDLISEEDYKIVDAHFSEIGLPLMMLERIKPMFLSVFASGDMDPAALQNGSMKSYEMEFVEMANNAGKETGGLETIEFQMSVFDSIPYEAQAEMLVESIKSGDEGSDEFDIMMDMYKSQNINAMISMLSDEEEQLSNYEDILLTKRNKAWIPQMDEMMKKEITFFAVGAGHLAGPNGVINLLKKEGYKLTPLSEKK